ncbi:MAG: ferredoxin family protein [Deltaproteobacteria bacterium]|nr:ferredoxin family protein [Deltaproteobacteria bacterium]
MAFKVFLVYCSPAGTTRKMARVVETYFPAEVRVLEAGRGGEDRFLDEMAQTPGRVLLWLGSPVYSSHALPLIMDFIARLPARPAAWSVPFVTWGGATSGLALEEMGAALVERGYPLLGAAKIMALHSLMFEVADPVGRGRPDAGDEKLMAELCAAVAAALAREQPRPLDPARLAYQEREAAAAMRQLSLKVARGILPPREVLAERCTGCGVCVENCPVAAVSLEPLPVYGESCILCFNCMRLCPEAAIRADLTAIHQRVRERAEKYSESPLSEIFMAG